MIGAMKRKASLTLGTELGGGAGAAGSGISGGQQPSPQSINCHDSYHPNPLLAGGGGSSMTNGGGTPSTSNSSSSTGSSSSAPHGPKPEKRIRWDGPRTQSLIDHYRTHEYLWNPKLADYKNDKKRTQCLEQWLEHNGLEKDLVNEVKMKLHGLRTSFGHQLKLEASANSGTNDAEKDGEGFQSKWQWYNQLSFLKETMVFRSNCSNNNHSPTDSPPHLSEHGHGHHHMGHHDMDNDVKMELSTPINMQVAHSHYPQSHELHEYLQEYKVHSQPQPHNLSVSAVVPMQAHESHMSTILPAHTRIKDEQEDALSYHHPRITATPPMAHMSTLSSHNQPPSAAVTHQQPAVAEVSARYQGSGNCCSCSCSERPKSAVGEKIGRLVEETFNNLHPEYQEMCRIEIQQVLGKYLQKPVP